MQTIDVIPEEGLKNVTPMSPGEARDSINRINAGVNSIRIELLELHRRQGWKALGYSTWKEFAESEFNLHRDRLYDMITAAEVEVNLVNNGIDASEISDLPESQLRAIAKAPITRQAAAFEALKAWESEDGKATEKEAEAAVASVDPNFAHQKATQLVTKFVASGADIDNTAVDKVFDGASPRLKEVLAQPVKELLQQAALKLPPSKPAASKEATTTKATAEEPKVEPMTEEEAQEVRDYLIEFIPSDLAIIIGGLPSDYKTAIRKILVN